MNDEVGSEKQVYLEGRSQAEAMSEQGMRVAEEEMSDLQQ